MGKRSREKREKKEKGEFVPKREKPEIRPVAICRGIILLGTYLILFTPFIISSKFFFPFVGPKSIYFMGLVEIIVAAYLFLILFNSKYRPRLNILLIALILFLVVLILSAVLGEDPSRSFWSKYERMTGLLMLFHLLAFFVVLSSVFKKQKDWYKIFTVSVFAATLMSLISLLPKMGMNIMGTMTSASRQGATIGNSSFLAAYLLFNIFLAFYLFLKSNGGLKIYSGFSFILITIALLLSGGRAAVMAFFGGIFLLFLLWLIFYKKGNLRLVGICFLIIYLVGVVGFMFLALQPDSFAYETFVKMSTKARLTVWEMSWNGWQERFWLGWGPENYEIVFTKHFDSRLFLQEYGTEIWFDRAHNIILDTGVTSGIIGLLGYFGIFISAFYVLWKKYFQQRFDFWTTGIFSIILISYFVQNLTVFDMVNSYMMFFLVLGFIASIASKKDDDPIPAQTPPQVVTQKKFGFLKSFTAVIILIFFSFSFFKFVIQSIKADSYVIDALRSPPTSEQRLSWYKKTLEASPLGKYQIREIFADSILRFPQTEAAKTASLEDFERELDFLSAELEKSIKESPLDYRAHLKLGHLYNVYNQVNIPKIAEAERVLNKAIELSPTNQQGYWALAQTKLYQRDFETAFSLAEKAVELEPRIAKSHFILVQIALFKGDLDLAEEKAAEAININPDWEPELKEILGKNTS